jgi:phosphate transport system permease protein
MKTQAENDFNRKRSRIDWIARQAMTASGWLVLTMFLLLIGHIFFNVVPLFKSPSLSLDYRMGLPKYLSDPIVLELIAGPSIIGKQACDLVVSPIKSDVGDMLEVNKRFPFTCSANIKLHKVKSGVYVSAFKTNEIVEIYELVEKQTSLTLELKSSVAIPTILLNKSYSFEFDFADDFAVIVAQASEHNEKDDEAKVMSHSSYAVWFQLSQPQNLFVQRVPRSKRIFPVTKLQQLILFSDKSVSFVDKYNQQLSAQVLEQNISSIVLSPNAGAILAFGEKSIMYRWVMVNQAGQFVFKKDSSIEERLHAQPIETIFDTNSNSALMFYEDGAVAFMNSISSQLFSWRAADLNLKTAQWAGDKVYGFNESLVFVFRPQNLQGITTLKSVLGQNWYEGYDGPTYAWQTSSADQHYDAKYNLVPLLIGSLKASLLALIVAIPLSMGAAIYTSYFATSSVKAYLKPSIEMLEAVPSVIIGFIAAVWLAPLAEQFLLSILIFIVLLPFFLIISAAIQPILSEILSKRFNRNWEVFFIVISTAFLAMFAFALGEVWQAYLFQMNSSSNLQSVLSISKTTLVVAVALGVAIAPSIYSLADDALSEVPKGLINASFALGASRLQTLRTVVIAVALPSLISAVMLGFGRAFGETMIVLMVTGNTPVSEWSIFEGLRAMTANLAIELQEADSDSAHFNLLFSTAAILFLFTFVLNTAAELLRNRLRKVVGNVKD